MSGWDVKKRKQHYVWEHYLRAWESDAHIWFRLRGGLVRRVHPGSVAIGRDFYRLKEMTPRDLDVVRQLLIAPQAPGLRDISEGWIPHFEELFQIRRDYESSAWKDAGYEKALDTSINNLEENLHAQLEGHAIPFLDALRRQDTRPFGSTEEEASVRYAWFLAAQYLRTPGMVAEVTSAIREIPGFNPEAAFGLMRTVLSSSLGFGFFSRLPGLRLTYLRAGSESEFITGDQPIFNIRAVGRKGVPPESEMELYYPLSPRLSVLVSFDTSPAVTDARQLTDAETLRYNKLISEVAHEQVYGASEGALTSS